MREMIPGLVSVVMPAYNCEKYLAESVASVEAQTYPHWELLLAEDHSTDGTYALAQSLAASDSRIRLLRTESNAGPAAARNLALENARGQYLAFLDSDDQWLPEKLSRQIAFMKETGTAFSCTAYDRIGENGEVQQRVTPFARANYNKVLYTANPVGNSTAMLDRSVLGELRVPPIRKRNDFALWLAALRKTDVVLGMPDCLGRYRVRESSVSSNKLDLLRYQYQLYHDIEGLNIFKLALAFGGLAYIKLFHPTWKKKEKT